MNKTRQLLLVVAIGLLAGPIAAQAQGDYDYQTIDHPGGTNTQVFGINKRGHAVGNGFADPDTLPFVYNTKNGRLKVLAPVAGYANTAVLGISDSGHLAGSVTSLDLSTESGLFLKKNGKSKVFDHPDAAFFTQARGINNKGLVAGYRDSPDDQFAPENGFIYDLKTGLFTDIVPSLFTLAHGINFRGDVVGNAEFDGNFGAPDPCGSSDPFVNRGWLRTADGTVIYFSVNGGNTSARGITNYRTIAGFVDDPGSGLTKGFVVELDGSQCQSFTIADADLLHFPGAVATIPEGIKNSGEVVGIYVDPTSNIHGFIATPR